MENNTCPCCKSTLATLASPLTTKLFWHWQHGLVFKKMAISGHSTQYSYTGTWYKVPANQTFRVGCSSQLQVNVCCTSDTPAKSPAYHFFWHWQCWLMFKNNSHFWSFYTKCLHKNLVQSPRKPDFDGWLFFSFKSTSAAPPTPRAASSYSSEAQMCNFVKCGHTLIIQRRTST